MKKVGIIGGSGFIGSYVTKLFLEEGSDVKVSATDTSKIEKYQHLKSLKNANNLEICALNVEDIQALKTFVEDCEILIHCGTPFQLAVNDPKKELFDPTIKGTENFLNVISESKEVKKVVFVASVAAFNTNFPMPADGRSADHVYSETDAPFISEESHPYAQAKYYADQAVRNYVNDHKDLAFEITSVYPVFVVGKPLSGRQDSTSVGLQFLLKNKLAPDPFMEMLYQHNVEFALVAVEDVAEGVFKAATTGDTHGKNYLLASDSWKVADMTLLLNNKQPEETSRIVYSNKLASDELGINFKSSQIPLNQFGA